MIEIICISITAGSLAFSSVVLLRLYRFEQLLKRARIVIAYKGKVKVNRPLDDWLRWCFQADKDRGANGQVMYQLGGTSIAVMEKTAKDHGKITTKTESNHKALKRNVPGAS